LKPCSAGPERVEDALARRKEARASKDFATADAIREELSAKGIDAMDADPLGWQWKLPAEGNSEEHNEPLEGQPF
jgi:cysteinyl-tRNA synthetase